MKSAKIHPLAFPTTRRQFLEASFGCALGLALGQVSRAAERKTDAVGFQLYTVRGEFSRGAARTLKTLAGIGYQAVEFWGYAGTANVYQNYSATDLRRMLDDNGLLCCGMHLDLKALTKENLGRTLENNRVLGNAYLTVAAAKSHMATDKGIAELAGVLNDAAIQCRPHKMIVGYHAHPFDFVKIDGRFAWDHLFSRTLPEVNMQMDVGNCLAGDGDPIAMFRKFPGRAQTIHVKEHGEKTFDSPYYREVFSLCPPAQTAWYIIEMGAEQGNGFDVPQQAFEKLRRALP